MVIELLGTLLFLVSVVGALGVLIALVYGVFSRQSRLIRVLLISGSVWLVVYSVLLVVASLLTPQQVLESHQERCFDEMCFSVLQATTQSTVGNGEQTQTAQGQYYVVTVQLRNASQRTAQKPDHPAFFLDDGQGRHFPAVASGAADARAATDLGRTSAARRDTVAHTRLRCPSELAAAVSAASSGHCRGELAHTAHHWR